VTSAVGLEGGFVGLPIARHICVSLLEHSQTSGSRWEVSLFLPTMLRGCRNVSLSQRKPSCVNESGLGDDSPVRGSPQAARDYR
jgi:hypothetical protein